MARNWSCRYESPYDIIGGPYPKKCISWEKIVQAVNKGEPHWGHVGDIKDMHRSLQDLNDRILQSGEYAKPIAMKEEAEQLTEDEELTQLLNTIYENLSDENKEIFEQILEEDPDQMIEFLEQLELQDGE